MPPVLGPASPSLQPLVILRGRQRQHVLAVDHDDEARLLARQEFLDDDARARVAHRVVDEHCVDRRVRVGERHRHDHALARGEAVGLDHDRRTAARRRNRAPRAHRQRCATAPSECRGAP